jgi:hypothetical protein
MPQVHRMFFHYSELPLSMRTLYTMTLLVMGIGYLFAMIQIYEVDAGRDGKPGLSASDIAIAYGGSKAASKLESALSGPMSGILAADDVATITRWVHAGADEAGYESQSKPIIAKRCAGCHDGSNPHLPNLSSYDDLAKTAQIDTGMSIATLVRVSHIHMFGVTFIFFIMGLIFSHAYVRPVWFKCAVIALPFLAVIIDTGSWYLTKINPAFAWTVIVGGALMGLSFATEWIVSMYQIWFYKYPGAGHPANPVIG